MIGEEGGRALPPPIAKPEEKSAGLTIEIIEI
jgi:hypothetical protein